MLNHKGVAHKWVKKAFTLDGTNNTDVQLLPDDFPPGLIRRVWARAYATAITLGGGSGIAGGGLVLMRKLHVESELHKVIYNNVNGKAWERVMRLVLGRALAATDPTSGGFSQEFIIPFALPGTLRRPPFRANDTALLNWKGRARPTITLSLGPVTDLVTGGSSPACSGTVDFIIEYEPNPAAGLYNPEKPLESGDEPGLQLDVVMSSLNTLGTKPEANFPVGQGRSLVAMLAREMDTSATPAVEASNVFTANTADFSLDYGTDRIVRNVPITSLDAYMTTVCNVALPSGVHFYLPMIDGKIGDAINLRDKQPLTGVYSGIANSSNRELQHVLIFARDLEAGASMAEQDAQSKNK